uniref:Class I SAM-dependent methyltransferase n=1 Tax=Desulfatirhabdium butyrativorans TaxID=340467 RepID=A0A7C4RTK4_9BACT
MRRIDRIDQEKAAFFDRQAMEAWANDAYTPDEIRHIDRMLRMAAIGTGSRVLEPGCGTGRLTGILCLAVGETGYVLAADISQGMIDTCRNRNACFPHLDLRCGAVEHLDLPPHFFDVVVCHAVFPHFTDPEVTLRILTQSLKVFGHLIVSHFMGSAELNDMHRKAAPVRNDRLPEESAMRKLFESNGLNIVHFEDRPGCYLLDAVKI